jgi:hypothetical protein
MIILSLIILFLNIFRLFLTIRRIVNLIFIHFVSIINKFIVQNSQFFKKIKNNYQILPY